MNEFVLTCPVCEKWQIDDVAVAGKLDAAVDCLGRHIVYCASAS